MGFCLNGFPSNRSKWNEIHRSFCLSSTHKKRPCCWIDTDSQTVVGWSWWWFCLRNSSLACIAVDRSVPILLHEAWASIIEIHPFASCGWWGKTSFNNILPYTDLTDDAEMMMRSGGIQGRKVCAVCLWVDNTKTGSFEVRLVLMKEIWHFFPSSFSLRLLRLLAGSSREMDLRLWVREVGKAAQQWTACVYMVDGGWRGGTKGAEFDTSTKKWETQIKTQVVWDAFGREKWDGQIRACLYLNNSISFWQFVGNGS